MFVLLFPLWAFANAKCYDGGGNFKLVTWPRCQDASDFISVYSGLSADGQFVKIGLQAQNHSKGWSAVGFSGNGGMKGASQIVVRMVNNQWVAEDRFSLDYVMPALDPKQDVQLLFAQDNGINTSWGVLIPKDSCDENDYAIENASRSLLWALGSSHTFTQHAMESRGSVHANLINGIVPFAPLNDVTVVQFKMPNATVISATADATNPYICGVFDLRELLPGRNLSEKVHVAKFSPYLDPRTASLVHHMILYGCSSNDGLEHGAVVKNCQSMPAGCNEFKWVWAVGGSDVQLPDDVGMPLGRGSYFLVLQMHYYNPTLLAVNDTSGVAVSFTSTNRPIDAAIMQLNGGTNPSLRPNLPANKPRFTLTPSLIVPAACTSDWTSPVNVVGAIHHMHLTGAHQRIEVARNGQHLGLMRYERQWDFKHQSLEEPLVHQLLAGDEIRLTCDYDTTGKMVETQFGENTDNEMCWAALMYYPAQTFSNAVIQPSPPLVELQKRATVCQVESTTFPQASFCAEVFFNDPTAYVLGVASNLTAEQWCNDIRFNRQAFYAEVIQSFPQLCPECEATNCTTRELVAHGQAICTALCAVVGLSVWPDLSQPPVYQEHRTYCDTKEWGRFSPNTTFPALPACVPKGDLANKSAVQTASAAVLVDQGGTAMNSAEPTVPAILVFAFIALTQ